MTPSTHEPLTPEEREMAQRLSRLGPHGGPSPALDAKILAAAHAAVAGPAPRRRRWWALTAVPGSLVTGAGMAAALALVVGVVWQMRPSTPPAQLPADDGDMGYISAEIIERAAPAAAPAPPPAQVESARVVSADAAAAAPAVARRQAPAAKARAEAAPAATSPAPAMDVAVAAADTGAAVSETYAAAPMVTATPAAEAEAQARHLAAQEAERESKSSLDRVEVTGSRVRAAKAMAAPAAPAAVAAASGYAETAGLMAPAQSLREVPVTLDATLDADAWMERIRARRDEGDLDGARASLVEFRKAYPKRRLPDDLRALAQPTR